MISDPPFTLLGSGLPRRLRGRLPRTAVTRARARKVVAARDPAVRHRRDPACGPELGRRERRLGRSERPVALGRWPTGAHRAPRRLRRSRAPLHDPLPEGDLRVRSWAQPLGAQGGRIRGTDDRRISALPARPGRDGAHRIGS